MRTLRGLTGFTLIACCLLALTGTAQAARRSALAGSLLIEDKDDLFFFPQLMPSYPNLIALDYGLANGSGNAVLTLGDDSSAFGLALHRGDVLRPHLVNELLALNGPASLFGPPAFDATSTPSTLVDFLFGASTGGDSAWGLRAAIGRGSLYGGNDADDGQSQMFGMLEGGYGWGTRGENTRVDLSGSFTIGLGSVETAGTDAASGTDIDFSVLMRGYAPMDATMDLGFLGNVAINSNTVTDEVTPTSPSGTTLAFTLAGGVGPAFRFGNANVAAYGVARVLFSGTDPNSEADNDSVNSHTIVIPALHMAAEIPVSDWLYVRTGAEYAFNINGSSDDGGGAGTGDDTVTASNTSAFNWNAGLGVVVDDFHFDGSFQHGFVTGGPDFIGGTAPGFLMIASLTYSFDKLRSGQVAVPGAAPLAPEPPPAPEPVPAPAPELQPAPPPPAPSPTGAVENPETGIGIGVTGGIQTAPAPAPPAPAPVH